MDQEDVLYSTDVQYDALQRAVVYEWMDQVEEVNTDNGWYESGRSFGDGIALLHSEVSEMFEEYRAGRKGRFYQEQDGDEVVYIPLSNPGLPYPAGKKPIGAPSEAADVLIRLLDECNRQGIDLYTEFRAKLEYNKTRGHRHGGKVV